ncbi:MAG: T9SS type A sorting domain-containing protein [Saprospirales bacterium]|nr:T9SS type A sorting domain-containing protein [Saprospirales bacterium]
MKPYIFTLLSAFLLLSNPLFSQWQRTGGPSGGYVNEVKANDEFLFAGSTNGIHRSADGGLNWQRLENGLPVSFTCYQIKVQGEQVLLMGSDNQKEYAAGREVYKSSDNGDHWFEIPLPDTAFVPDEITLYENKIYVADKTLHRSEDDGATWTQLLSLTYHIHDLEVYDERLFALGNQDLWATNDWGDTWSSAQLPITGDANGVFSKDSLLLLAGSNKAFRSLDQGQSWEEAGGWEGDSPEVKDIVLLNDTFYVNTLHPLRSGDGGLNWERVFTSNYIRNFKAMAGFDGKLFACRFGEGLFLYDPAMGSLSISDWGIDASAVSSLSVHGGFLWAGAGGRGLFRYDLAEESWDTVNYFPTTSTLYDLAWVGDSLFLLEGSLRLFRSGDGGQTWTDASPLPVWWMPNLGKFEVHGQTLFVFARSGARVGQSDDFGESWQMAAPSFFDQFQIYPDNFLSHGPYLFVSDTAWVYRSADEGLNWELKSEGIAPSAHARIKSLHSAGGALFAEYSDPDSSIITSKAKLYVSYDDGESWASATAGLPVEDVDYESEFVLDLVAFQDTFVISLFGEGIYFKKQNEPEWQPLTIGRFPRGARMALSEDKLFLGTPGMGVWQMNATNIPMDSLFFAPPAGLLAVFPNPAQTHITLPAKMGSAGEGTLLICNVKGRVVLFDKIPLNTKTEIPIASLPEGVYFIRLETEEGVFEGKFLRQE